MEKWEIFENDCVNVLNKNFSKYDVIFEGAGKSDSTQSDIKVLKNNELLFFIECKMDIAQSGQFVLLPTERQFIYSPRNKSELNTFSQIILDYINDNFEFYRNVGTASLDINLPKEVFNSWIINHYKSKNAKYIITLLSGTAQGLIFPVENLGDYFNVTANFRIKGSGSSSLPNSHCNAVSNFLSQKYGSNYNSMYKSGNKYLLECSTIIPDKTEFSLDSTRYFIREQGNNTYEIRKLSNTRNANVIFSVKSNGTYNSNDLKNFISDLCR
jgi:hypothetical protein